MKPVSMLPNLLTLANCGCGLLAISKGIDALAFARMVGDGRKRADCRTV